MKTLLMILNLLLISGTTFSQRPLAVDNSQYFPPFKGQQNVPNCTNFSLIYYLKSSIWNREYNRNPVLEENQFAHSFIWNQNVDTYNSMSGTVPAFHLMESVGCAPVSEFPLDETSAALKPDYKTKEKALSYKSNKLVYKNFIFTDTNKSYEENISLFLNQLKDSLVAGKNFTLGIDVYAEFIEDTDSGEVYNYLPKYEDPSLRLPAHVVTIAGYNDTIETLNGKGAFLAINSSSRLPLFYMDYEWFYQGRNTTSIYFLIEDFDSKPELALHLSLEKSLDNRDRYMSHYLFVDTLIKKDDKMVDFKEAVDYSFRPNLARIVKLNDQRIPIDSLPILFPTGNIDGNYNVISDLTEIVKRENFESVEIIVNDPIEGEFISDEDGLIYGYKREPEARVAKSFVSIIGTDSTAIGEVTELADTTIIFNDFYCLQARIIIGRTLSEEEMLHGIYVKTGKSVLARKLITIRKEDFMGPLELVNSLDTLVVYQDSIANWQFDAKSQEGTVSYNLALNDGGSINSSTGMFTFSAIYDINIEEAEWHDFVLEVKSGTHTVRDSFVVEVRPRINKLPMFFFVSDSSYHYECIVDSVLEFDYYIYDPELKEVSTGVYNLPVEISGASLVSDGQHDNQYRFYYRAEEVGEFTVQIFYSDGYHLFTKDINITVSPYTSTHDRYKANFKLSAYPNPVTDNLNFEFNLPERSMINIEVYSLVGQLIKTAVSESFESGYNRVTVSSSDFKPGTYLCRLRDENNLVETIKIIKR